MIYGFFGSIPGCPHDRGTHALRGNGKTLSLTFVGYVDYLNGRHIIANYKTSFGEYVSIDKIAEMVLQENIRDTTILLSELQVYLNSLGVNTTQLKEFIGSVVGQSRKRNVDIHYDTQRYTDIHPRMRVQTDRAFLPRKYHLDGAPCQKDHCQEEHLIRVFQHDPYRKEPVVTLRASAFKDLYDTNEILFIPPSTPKRSHKKKESIL